MRTLPFRSSARTALRVVLGSLALALALPGSAQASSYPADIAPRIAALSPDKQAFLRDEARLAMFHLTPEKIANDFRTRTQAEIDAYVSGLMQVMADAAFHPGVDKGAIALNPDATGFNAGTTLKPPMFDAFHRDPGPISLDHYMFQPSGIPTFAHAPVAVRKEDLIAGHVEVAFVGVPIDFSSGWRDGKHGPMFLRSTDGLVGNDVYTGIDPATVLSIADYGDLATDYMSVERTVDHVRFMIGDMARTGAAPFIVGGDHSLMYPDIAAMSDTYGKGKVGIVQFDAHYEGETGSAHFFSDNQSLQRLIADGVIDGHQVVQVGVRGPEMTSADAARLRADGVTMLGMDRVEKEGWTAVARTALDAVKAGPGKVFISFDMSVLDPAYAAGAGRPVPNGLTMREAVPLVREICASAKVVGFELLDYAQVLDVSYRSPQNANYILHSCLAGIAERKLATMPKG